ncbi:hypothetical protein, partial [Eisenbergiella porci]|uniref:hypothetical protein n=1 Tax=Eisenbergiella porci TaxID=2652274 RepID=UPI003A9061B8
LYQFGSSLFFAERGQARLRILCKCISFYRFFCLPEFPVIPADGNGTDSAGRNGFQPAGRSIFLYIVNILYEFGFLLHHGETLSEKILFFSGVDKFYRFIFNG